jgi:ElaB/YqjD/DUF883 family membrane-anchored ribosome-binding protein
LRTIFLLNNEGSPMDNPVNPPASDVAGIKASFSLNAGRAESEGNTGTRLGEGVVSLERRGVESARRAVDRVAATAHEAVDRLGGRASRLAAKVDEKTQRLVQAPQQARAYSKETVSSRPAQAVAASVAAGFVLGWLVRGRLNRHRSD